MKEKICKNPNCHKLGKLQPLSDFHKLKRGKFGRKSRCKFCEKIRRIEKEKEKEKQKEKEKKEPTKESTICSLCGKTNCIVKGHHKDFNTRQPLLLCGGCHRIVIKIKLLNKEKK